VAKKGAKNPLFGKFLANYGFFWGFKYSGIIRVKSGTDKFKNTGFLIKKLKKKPKNGF
jgi:hypothetical protein